MTVTGARCGHPVRPYVKPGRDDFSAACWRPAGHRSAKHLSRYAYLRELARSRARQKARRERRAA